MPCVYICHTHFYHFIFLSYLSFVNPFHYFSCVFFPFMYFLFPFFLPFVFKQTLYFFNYFIIIDDANTMLIIITKQKRKQ